jgi:sugar O-acyltransferase (sialic acid O-acetyltransferase NeuD family)
MIIIGAGGHAKEVAGVLREIQQIENLFFYDDVTENIPSHVWDEFRILRSEKDAKEELKNDPRFVLGIGSPKFRHQLTLKFESIGGILTSVISPFARIGTHHVKLSAGLNIMTGAVITESISIGRGSLIHIQTSIHHDAVVGEFCEVLPGSHVLGNVAIGDFTSIGSGAIILPKIKIGNNVTVGAGAVVTKNLTNGAKVKGVPAK